MTRVELQEILGYLNIGLALAHSTGVRVGHFGDSDFIELAQRVNGLLLRAIEPAATGAGVGAAAASPVELHAPMVAGVSLVS